MTGKQQLIRGVHNLRDHHRDCVATIGAFDGVHLGHQRVLQRVKQLAAELALPTVVIIFEPLPREFFSGEQAPARVMRLREKVEALFKQGVDTVLCIPFNQKLRSLTATDFIHQILAAGLGVKHLVVGDDFRFGCDRKGDFELLKSEGDRLGFAVEDTATFVLQDQRVSSTLIRDCLEQGQFEQAELLLGKPFSITGRVVHGQQLGKQLGIPTANVNLKRNRAPLQGVYAAEVNVAGQRLIGAANVGVRPTIGDIVKPVLEVHILDFSEDLYGQTIEVIFRHKIRDEAKFSSLDQLVEAIQNDINQTRCWFEQRRNSRM